MNLNLFRSDDSVEHFLFNMLLDNLCDPLLCSKDQHLYQYIYDQKLYGAWSIKDPFLKAYVPFEYYGNRYIIREYEYIHRVGMGLFILNDVFIPWGGLKDPLMPFYGLIYSKKNYLQLAKKQGNIRSYIIFTNWQSNPKPSKCLYIDGRPKMHGNIAGYINNLINNGFLLNDEFHHFEK